MENVNPNTESTSTGERPLGEIVKDIRTSMMDVIRAELRLVKLELSTSLRDVRQNTVTLAIGSVLAALGVLPLMAFLVIGLGRLLNGNYWLSSLIWTAVFVGVGGFLAYRSLRRMRLDQLSLPHSRHVLLEEGEAIGRKVKDMPTHLRRVV